MELADFHNLHAGETCLLVGNGPNLHLTPPEWFEYPSFGMNTCHLWAGEWVPDYYVTVDQRVMREFGEAVYKKYQHIPKFIPRPNLNAWQGENFYRFLHRPGQMCKAGYSPRDRDALTIDGISYRNVMQTALQIAWHMGFVTFLMIGVQHKPYKAQVHFWGTDHGMPAQAQPDWFPAYKLLAEQMDLRNISPATYVPEDILPRDDWRKYAQEKSKSL